MKAFIIRHRPILQFCSLFLLLLLLIPQSIWWLGFYDAINDRLTLGTAITSTTLLRLIGYQATRIDRLIISPGLSIEIINGCNGYLATIILLSAMLAFPSGWLPKALGVFGGPVMIFLLNQVRIVSLYLIGLYFPSLFKETHLYVWQTLLITATLVVWVAWADWSLRNQQAATPRHR